MLNLQDITLHYGNSQILYDISMQAKLGEVTCVMGTNGVGKTSLLRAISGTHPRSGGDLAFDGHSLGKVGAHKMAQLGLGYVPQGRDIFPLLTVRENLQTGFACLPRFPVLREMAHRRGGDLSGGQQQQLAIARALISKPKLLLLDEPTEGIQPNIIQHIGKVIGLLRDRGDMAIVLVEQYFDFAFGLADQIIVLQRGKIIKNTPKAQCQRADILASVSV